MVIPIVIGALGTVKRMSGNYSIAEIGQNTEKSPGNLRRLVVTQTPEKDYQLMLKGKNSQEVRIVMIMIIIIIIRRSSRSFF